MDYTQVADYYKGAPGEYVSYVYTDFLTREGLPRWRDAVEAEVREKLGIPFNVALPAQRFEHSMGQLPPSILRQSVPNPLRVIQ